VIQLQIMINESSKRANESDSIECLEAGAGLQGGDCSSGFATP
jgi:hypothetical protein